MKKLAILPVLFVMAFLSFSACTEEIAEGPTTIEVIEADLTQEFTGVAETRFIPVNFGGTFTYKMSDSDWCTAKRTGNGNVVTGINISVTANPTAEARTATITLIAEDTDEIVIEVIQHGAEPFLEVVEPASGILSIARTGGEARLSVTLNTNFAVKFETSDWIHFFSEDTRAGVYRFSVDAYDTDQYEPRSGHITVLPESSDIVWTDVTKVAVSQMGYLPDAPEIPESLPGLDAVKAAFADICFTAEGYSNTATAPMAIEEGSDGVPPTVWSDETNSYVLSLTEPVYWIPTGDDLLIDPATPYEETGGFNKKYLAVMYQGGATADYPDRKSDFTGASTPFAMETWLKVTNAADAIPYPSDGVTESFVNLISSRDRNQNGNFANKMGIGFRVTEEDGMDKLSFFASTGGQAWTEVVAKDACPSDYVHLFCTRGGGKIALYVNGVLQQETAIGGLAMPWLNRPDGVAPVQGLGLGGGFVGMYCGTVNCMEGEIAFYRWYDRTFTADEVAARYEVVSDHAGELFVSVQTRLEWLDSVVGNTGDTLREGMEWAIETGRMIQSNFDADDQTAQAWLDYVTELEDYYNQYYL